MWGLFSFHTNSENMLVIAEEKVLGRGTNTSANRRALAGGYSS